METKTQRWVLAVTSLAALLVMLDLLVVTAALDTIRRDLGASLQALEWTVTAYTLTFAVLLMTGSALGDRYGRRRMLVAGLVVFTTASVLCALAPGVGWLIADRAVQGAGSALIMPNAMALLGAAFPPELRAKALGLFSAITGLATLGGPVLGGAVVEHISWQWIFWLNVPIGLALVPLARTRVAESRGAGASFDIGGIALVSGAASAFVWGLVRGNESGWGSSEVIAALLAGCAFTGAFVAWERRAAEPMLPLRFFGVPAFGAGNLAGFLLYGSIVGSAFFIVQYLQVSLGASPLAAGLRLAPWTVTLFLVAPFAGAGVQRFGERPFLVGGMVLQGIGFAWLAVVAGPDTAYATLIAPLVLAGIGVSAAMPAAQNAVLGAVDRTALGTASGTFNMSRQLGGSFGVAVLAALFARTGSYGSPAAFSDGFAVAMAGAAALSLAAAAAGLATNGRRAFVAAPEPVPAQ